MLAIAASLLGGLTYFASANSCPAVDGVNSFIGTGGLAYGYGGVNPGAQYPSGPMRLGPDSTNTVANIGYRHFSGYNYFDDQIRAFSHTHLVGAGINDLGTFGVMPVRLLDGSPLPDDILDIDPEQHTRGWWSMFNKTSETASPGNYAVFLDTPRVQVNLLATSTLTGIHQYEFAAAADGERMYTPAVVVDVCHAAHVDPPKNTLCRMAELHVAEDMQSFTATVYFSNKLWVYMYGEFGFSGLTPKKWDICSNENADDFQCSRNARDGASNNGLLFSRVSFGPVNGARSAKVELRVAISFISADQAKANFNAVDNSKTARTLTAETYRVWCNTLSYLDVTALDGDADLATMLYSANYRVQMTPTDYTEAGGFYRGLDQTIHDINVERAVYSNSISKSEKVMKFYSDFSFWDTFRTLHPWLLLTDESLAIGAIRSVGEMTVQQNGFPRWVLASVDISCMIGLHGATAVAEAALIGYEKEFDLAGMQRMLLNQATQPWPVNGRNDIDHYLSEGYVSAEVAGDSASLTLTYAFDDFVLGVLSELVGDSKSAEEAFARGKNYRNSWSPDMEIMCPRSVSGELQCPRTPTAPEAWTMYREGDSHHWTTFVPHDPVGLKGLFSSDKAYEAYFEAFFEKRMESFNKLGNAAPNPYYWPGNEVCMFALWMFNFDSNCARAQYWSRNVTNVHFTNTPHGVPGNEDYGSMSSWLLFTSLGVFPQAGTTNFMIGSPRVRDASVKLTHLDGTTSVLQVITNNNSAENVYVESLLVNGQPYASPIIDRSVLAAPGGCKLEFTMTSTPKSGLCPSTI